MQLFNLVFLLQIKQYRSSITRVFFIKFCLQLLFICFASRSQAQEYFQQKVDYTITAELNDIKHSLSCFQTIVYTNNSPYELNEMYIHLWPNAYKNETTPLAKSFYLDGFTTMLNLKKKDSGYIDSLDFQVDGERVTWTLLKDSIDICKIKLNKALAPGASLRLTTPFHVQLPSAKISRLGHLEQAYFITQWYPKPAVYDKYGWNYFSYLDKGEYYGEFGSFDVSITLPENYVVGATGELQDGSKELYWLSEKAKLTMKTDQFPEDMDFPPSSTTTKTLRYTQNNIHDFAWFADKRWNVLKGKVEIPGREKPITTWAFFTNAEGNYWKKVPEHLHDAITYFSKWIAPYPYNSVTAVDVTKASGDGMEYPMITAIGNYGDPFELEEVVVHEVAHNWFYGIIGNNERRHPWMDEGLTNFYETRYLYTKHAKDSSRQEEVFTKIGKKKKYFKINKINHRDSQYLSYLMTARNNSDQQPDLTSEKFSRLNYPKASYHKMTLGFDYLMMYLGDSLFDACIKNYYAEWKFKHPMPEDMHNAFRQTSGKDLDWFFNDFIFSTKKIEYSITSLHSEGNSFRLEIKNKNRIAAPVSISALNNGKIQSTVWSEGFRGKKNINITCEQCDEFRIDAQERMPELYRNNNSIRTKGLLKRVEKLQIAFPAGLEDGSKTQRFYAPVAGWNYYNGPMAGLVLHNVFFPEKKFEFTFMPLFAFKTLDLAGGGDLRYHFYPHDKLLQKITLRSGYSHYAYGINEGSDPSQSNSTVYYSKLDNRFAIQFKEREPRKQVENYLTLRHVWIERGLFYSDRNLSANYFQVEYQRNNLNALEASGLKIQLTGNNDFNKASIESNHFINYNSTKKGFFIRTFAAYLKRYVTHRSETDLRLRSSGYSGTDDYLFDEVFLGRTESSGILSQQFYTADGGLRIPTLFYRKADTWMASITLSSSLPGKLPFKLYATLAGYNNAKDAYPASKAVSYDAGVELPIIKDIFVIYFPVIWSSDIEYIVDGQNWNYGELIRWELRLTRLNPLEQIRKIKF